MKQIFKVVSCGDLFTVKSEKSENGVLNKRHIVLQELGGKYENSYIAALLGKDATLQFYGGDIVAVALRFSTREYNGQNYQDIIVSDIVKLNR